MVPSLMSLVNWGKLSVGGLQVSVYIDYIGTVVCQVIAFLGWVYISLIWCFVLWEIKWLSNTEKNFVWITVTVLTCCWLVSCFTELELLHALKRCLLVTVMTFFLATHLVSFIFDVGMHRLLFLIHHFHWDVAVFLDFTTPWSFHILPFFSLSQNSLRWLQWHFFSIQLFCFPLCT